MNDGWRREGTGAAAEWWGIFYFLFIWTLIPFFVAFIEGIVFLVTDHVSWDRKYGPT
jgi:hypothetical protein